LWGSACFGGSSCLALKAISRASLLVMIPPETMKEAIDTIYEFPVSPHRIKKENIWSLTQITITFFPDLLESSIFIFSYWHGACIAPPKVAYATSIRINEKFSSL
jgi:hypothetical protein